MTDVPSRPLLRANTGMAWSDQVVYRARVCHSKPPSSFGASFVPPCSWNLAGIGRTLRIETSVRFV